MKYINKEKMASQEIATVTDVDRKISKSHKDLATKEELEKVKIKVSILERTVENLVKAYDPPVTKEKITRHLRLAEKELQ